MDTSISLPFLRKWFVVFASQASLIIYLLESWSQTSGSQANIDSLLIFNTIFYIFISLIGISILRHPLSGNLKIIYFILTVLLLVGMLNSDYFLHSIVTYFKYLLYICIFLYIASLDLNQKYSLLSSVINLSLIMLILASAINILRGASHLFGLVQIQLPLLTLAIFYLFFVKKDRALIFISMSVLLVFFSFNLAINSDFFRIQYLPFGMVFLMLLFLLTSYFFKSRTGFLLVALTSFTLLILNFSQMNEIFYLEARLVSFLERLNIFLIMLYDSYFFIIPQGLGADERDFDISSLGLGDRGMYPSHSGLGSELYNNSIVLFLMIYFFIFYEVGKILRASSRKFLLNISNEIPNLKKHIYSKKAHYHYRLFLFIILFWFIHNLFYLKGIIGPAYFSDDGIILYMLLFAITREVYFVRREC